MTQTAELISLGSGPALPCQRQQSDLQSLTNRSERAEHLYAASLYVSCGFGCEA